MVYIWKKKKIYFFLKKKKWFISSKKWFISSKKKWYISFIKKKFFFLSFLHSFSFCKKCYPMWELSLIVSRSSFFFLALLFSSLPFPSIPIKVLVSVVEIWQKLSQFNPLFEFYYGYTCTWISLFLLPPPPSVVKKG